MQLSSRDGIVCDYCGAVYTNDFTYYSFDFKSVSVISGRVPSLQSLLSESTVLSMDICPECFNTISNKIVQNNKKMSKNNRICEWSGQTLSGNYDLYYCVVTKADVRLSGQPNICSKCGHQTFEDGPCSKCNGGDFTRPASVSSDQRHLEFQLSEESYIHFSEKIQNVRKIASEWSTKS